MPISELIITIAEDIKKIDKHHLMLMLHLANIITKEVKRAPSYIFDLQVIVSAELLKRGIPLAELEWDATS
jgi:hypothetical protein